MRSMQSASSEASWTVTISLGNELVKKALTGDGACWMPSVQNSAFFRDDLDDDFSECLRDDDDADEDARVLTEAAALLELLLAWLGACWVGSSSMGR